MKVAGQHRRSLWPAPGHEALFVIDQRDLPHRLSIARLASLAEVRAAIDHAIGRILHAGKAPGILCADETLARHYMALGARFVAVGVDTSLLVRATAALAAQYKQAAPVATSSGAY